MVEFGKRLKIARTARHLSQQELADLMGKSLNTASLYERGLRQPSLETLSLLADALDVSVDYLLGRTDDMKSMNTQKNPQEDFSRRLQRIEEILGIQNAD